jgi:hypothetical protein
MPLVILHHLLNVSVQLAIKGDSNKNKKPKKVSKRRLPLLAKQNPI